MRILEKNPTEIKPATSSDFQHISEILPEVLSHIIQAAQLQHNPERTERRSCPLRRAA